MAALVRNLARPADSVGGANRARRFATRRFGNSQAEPVLPSGAELRSNEAAGASAMTCSAKRLARPAGYSGRTVGARQGLTRHVDLGGSISRRPTGAWLRCCIEAADLDRSGELARPARQRGSESRTRQTPMLGLAPAELRRTTGWSLTSRCARAPRKNRQSGLNSRWRLKASGCVKEGPQSRLGTHVPCCGWATNASERAVPGRDIGNRPMPPAAKACRTRASHSEAPHA
jgi:hypothetical protein